MGTRGLILFIRNGKRMGIFNQFDSYLSGLGVSFFKFLKMLIENEKFVDFIDSFFKIEPNEEYYNTDAMKVLNDVFENKPTQYCNAEKFQNDDLFCEWCYIVDVDNSILTIECGGCEFKSMKITIDNIDKAVNFFAD